MSVFKRMVHWEARVSFRGESLANHWDFARISLAVAVMEALKYVTQVGLVVAADWRSQVTLAGMVGLQAPEGGVFVLGEDELELA